MTCEEKAQIFARELALVGGDVLAAFRRTEELSARRRFGKKLDEVKVAEIRRRRAEEGQSLKELAIDFGVSETWISHLCRDIPAASARTSLKPPPGAVEILARIGDALGLDSGWQYRDERQRHPAPAAAALARNAALLALREAAFTWKEIAVAFGRCSETMLMNRARRARTDVRAREIADQVGAGAAAA